MINKTDKRMLKRLLGSGYASDVLAYLNETGIVNQQGNSHKTGYIYKVMNGHRYNRDVEKVLWILAAKRKEEKNILKEAVKSKKPEAVTSGL